MKVRLTDILTEGPGAGRFSFSFEPDIGGLARSIKEIGLVNPPILRDTGGGFEVVCGFKRVLACISLGSGEIDARAYGKDEIADAQCLWFSLIDNAQPGRLSPVEYAIALKKFSEHGYDSDKLAKEVAPSLGLPSSKRYIENCLQLLALDKEILRALHDGSFGVEQAFCVQEMKPESRLAIFRVLCASKANLNETRELAGVIPDVAAMKRMTVTEFIEEEIASLVDDDSLPPRKKLQQLREYLVRARYPRLTGAESAFEAVIERMNLGKEFHISAPKHFEGSEISMTIHAKSANHFKGVLMKLSSVEVEKDFERLFSVLRGRDMS
jgi:ParB/RepB/Spo0J family partition protein